MMTEYDDYQTWLQQQDCGSPTVFLDNLLDWLEAQCSDRVDAEVLKGLARCETEGDPIGFMKLLSPYRKRLGSTVSGILYHRWIRLIALNLLSLSYRKTVEHIAIAYLPQHPLPESFITATPRGHVVCFSETHSYVLLTLFQTIIANSFKTSVVSPSICLEENDLLDRIIDLAHMYSSLKPHISITPLGLNDSQIYYSDLIHNNLQLFIMCHEFGHFILGHLQSEPLPRAPHSQSVNIKTQVNHFDDPKERAADDFAARLINGDNKEIKGKAILFSSIAIHFYFIYLCRLVMGFEQDSLQPYLERGLRIGFTIFEDSSQIYQCREVETMLKAIERYESYRDKGAQE